MQITFKLLALTLTILVGCGAIEDKKNGMSEVKSELNSIRNDSLLVTGWYYIVDIENDFKRQLDKDTTFYFLDPIPILTAKNITILEIYESTSGDVGLSMRLDEEGTEAWSIATEKATYKKLAFVVDNKLLYTPEVKGQITGGVTALNRGVYSKKELEKLKLIIEKEK